MFTDDKTFYFIYDIFLVFLGTSITITNLIIVGIYCFTRKIRTKTANLLLCNQAIVDIFNGAVAGGITIFSDYAPDVVKQGIYQFSIALSLHTVVLISIERYIFILKPLYHRTSVTKGKIMMSVIISWALSLVWIPLRLIHYQKSRLDWESYVYFIAVSDCVIFLMMASVGCLHVLTYRAVKKFIMSRLDDMINVNKRKSILFKRNIKYKHHLKEMRVSKIFISMFVAFICTYLPVFVTGIVYIAGGFQSVKVSDYKYFSLDLLFYLYNSLFNPIVTLAFKEDYRKNFRKCISSIYRVTSFLKRFNLTATYTSTPMALCVETIEDEEDDGNDNQDDDDKSKDEVDTKSDDISSRSKSRSTSEIYIKRAKVSIATPLFSRAAEYRSQAFPKQKKNCKITINKLNIIIKDECEVNESHANV